jgi:hypothetical protein
MGRDRAIPARVRAPGVALPRVTKLGCSPPLSVSLLPLFSKDHGWTYYSMIFLLTNILLHFIVNDRM